MAEQLIAAEFFGNPVSIVDHSGKRWLTAEQVGRCLGYSEENTRKGISKLFNTHADEFTETDTCVVNLATQNSSPETTTNSRGNPNTRIFSASGCIKLGFFANTARAKQFRTWAAATLETVGAAPAALPSVEASLKMTRQKERIALEMFVAGHDIAAIGKHIGVSRSTASLVLHGKYQFAPGAGTPECSPALIAAVAARHLAIEQARIAQMQERAAQRYLTSANNQALADALEQVGRHLQQAPALALTAPKGGE